MSESNRQSEDSGGPSSGVGRPYIGVHFECCSVYLRVYRRPEQRVYVCRCPRCLRTATVRVGEGGTSNRFFKVT